MDFATIGKACFLVIIITVSLLLNMLYVIPCLEKLTLNDLQVTPAEDLVDGLPPDTS